MKRITILALVLLLFGVTTMAQAADGSWDRVKKEGKLVIGLDDSFPPMGFKKDDGKLVGFDIDAAEELGKRLGIQIVWQPTAWDGVILSLDSKKFDCIWNGMTITEDRKGKVLFTDPYIMDGQIAVVKAGSPVKAFADLGGKVLGVQKGSSAVEAVKKLPKAASEVKEYDANPKAFLDLDSGRLAAVVIDNVSGRYFVATNPGKYTVLPGFITKEPFGIAFRKGEADLKDMIQKTLGAMVADGTMAKISKKWFGEDITDPKKW
ncbi:L-cystine-binding protein FliY [Fundidesulfovibrio magnetotacticus]|uniref:L-cystine-binding protein FliY n=1 Tax=Fundidesulfovibrio magnetotacticus TaxID=2730080 RepID=A0A6V8LY92_9BACT|nr:amino acid ABC transporter substrate-binding protein [Fundidesulfovibrio magnetotacticus]GFK93235.1 L-cystine-binding protein FliY [Fundidesulfovibrio magnetotacticus]